MKPETSFTFSLISLVLFFFWSYAVLHFPGVTHFDSAIYGFISAYTNPFWILANRYITYLGNGELLFVVAIVIGACICKKSSVRAGFWYFIALVVGQLINASLKVFFGQPRPESIDATYFLTSFSYPSGHAAGAVVFYLMSFWVLNKLWPKVFKRGRTLMVASIIILAVGITRIDLGVHWVSDVVGGYLFGLFWVFFNLMLVTRFKLFPQERI